MVSGVSKNGAKLLLWEDGDGEEAGLFSFVFFVH